MKNILIGFALALGLFLLGVAGYVGYHTVQLTRAAATYLFAETEVKDKDGKPLSRADLIDALLRDAVGRAAPPPAK